MPSSAGEPDRTWGQRTLTATGWVIVSSVLLTAAAALRSIILARFVGADAFGIVALALIAIGALDVVAGGVGIQTALIRQQEPIEDDLPTALTLQATRGAAVTVLLWVTAPLVAEFFESPLVEPVLRGLSLIPLLQGFSNPAVALRIRTLRFENVFWWQLPDVFFGLAFTVGAIMIRQDVWAIVVSAVGAQAASTACSYGVVRWRPRFALAVQTARRLIRYGGWVQATRVVTYLCVYGDNAVVGRLLGPAALGLYQIAFRVSELPSTSAARVAARVALPALSELRTDTARLRSCYFTALRTLLAVNVAFALLLVIFAGSLVPLLLGSGWEPAIPVLRILAVAMVFRSVLVLGAELFNAIGAPQAALQVQLVRLMTMAVGIVPLTLRLGIEGAAISVLLAAIAGSAVQWNLVRTALGASDVSDARRRYSAASDANSSATSS